MADTSWADIVAIIVSGAALVLTFINNRKCNSLQKQSNALQQQGNELQGKYNAMVAIQTKTGIGALELQLSAAIDNAFKDVQNKAIELSKNPQNETIKNVYLAAEEDLRNVFEDACLKYIQDKIDKNWFKNLYFSAIRKLVEEKPHSEFYEKNQSPYTNTIAVYREWHQPKP